VIDDLTWMRLGPFGEKRRHLLVSGKAWRFARQRDPFL